MHIRRYMPTDFEPTVALWRRTMRAAYTYLPLTQAHTLDEDRGYFREHIEPTCEIWLAEDASGLVGFLALRDDYVDRLYVAVGRQRQGIGRRLLARAQERSPAGLCLHTHRQNEGACRFYEREGFVPVAYGLSPPPESEPDVLYRWTPA